MSPRTETSRIQPARRVAYDVISAVSTSDAYANLLLPVRIDRAKLSTGDAALATELTYGTLRMRGFYDRVISLTAGRPVEKIDGPVLDALRLGAHQLLSMRTADHAAVNESVELAREYGSRSASGFANGVLRTISRSTLEEWREAVVGEESDPDEKLALLYSHPAWIVRALRQGLDAEGRADELEALLAADNAAPRVNLVALPHLVDSEIAASLGEANRYSPVGHDLGGGDPTAITKRSHGTVRVQDEGSQLAALALSRVRPVEAGERWLDLCAGPGGKAALLAAEALAGGAELLANELVPARAELVRSALSAVSSDIEVAEFDGTEVGEMHPAAFDRIMLDAPCTGLGALRRRPEARWRKSPRDVAELSSLQARLFDAAVVALKPGGVLAYVTCSPHTGETLGAVRAVASRWGDDLEPLDTRAVLADVVEHPLDLAGDPHTVQLWPHRHGTDAMFIALFRRT
ncbi:RsmB/NOP family class I SAM-dependent RNA methyltransferase [Leifsonia flava]|uniref:rRNA small subunit methyltransferase B n=1 Tax=Orlajensenia leifsoniae TaxID=2561933 RepID=A0A4Y9R4X3_9MICO|nr:transcription antitermination factor NusB [Leifsonia flava]TFV98972.1 rRNA small subunit methyltransferase B [Leifsonia flava]